MKKVLLAEIVILIILVGVAVGLVLGEDTPKDVPAMQTQPIQLSQTEHTEPSQTIPTTENVTQATTLPEETVLSTEPETVEVTWMTFEKNRKMESPRYFLYDVDRAEYVICSEDTEQERRERVYPASVTKLFTCYVVMQYLEPDTVLTVGDELNLVPWDSSIAWLKKGDQLKVSQLIAGLLLPSGNDAAHVLAVNTGRVILGDPDAGYNTALEAYMEEMNRLAREVGMTGSYFCTPDGYHRDDHYMCLDDLALLGVLSVNNSKVMSVAGTLRTDETFVFAAQRDAESGYPKPGQWKNTNALLNPESEFYCPYATGLKTGTTSIAGACLLSSFEIQGRRFVAGAFGAQDGNARFRDVLNMFNLALEREFEIVIPTGEKDG